MTPTEYRARAAHETRLMQLGLIGPAAWQLCIGRLVGLLTGRLVEPVVVIEWQEWEGGERNQQNLD